MRTVLIVLGIWIGLSLVATLTYMIGAALGRRSAWEEAYEAGYRQGLQEAHPDLRIEHSRAEGHRTT